MERFHSAPSSSSGSSGAASTCSGSASAAVGCCSRDWRALYWSCCNIWEYGGLVTESLFMFCCCCCCCCGSDGGESIMGDSVGGAVMVGGARA